LKSLYFRRVIRRTNGTVRLHTLPVLGLASSRSHDLGMLRLLSLRRALEGRGLPDDATSRIADSTPCSLSAFWLARSVSPDFSERFSVLGHQQITDVCKPFLPNSLSTCGLVAFERLYEESISRRRKFSAHAPEGSRFEFDPS
jgi:hypothetical protein